MSVRAGDWRQGHLLLRQRVAAIPAALASAFAGELEPLEFDPCAVRRYLVTGIGCSAAHAHFLVHLLSAEIGVAARFVPMGEWVSGRVAPACADVLAVFSQGISPNARFALVRPADWQRLVLFTATSAGAAGVSGGAAASVAALREAGASIRSFPGAEERGTLLRVLGPMCAYAAALRFAAQIGSALGVDARPLRIDAAELCGRVAAADETLDRALDGLGESAEPLQRVLSGPVAFLAQGSYSELVDNLRFKVMEGLLRPQPPVWDLLHFAHGPFQQAFCGDATFLALTCAAEAREEALLARIDGMTCERHHLLRLPSSLPAPLAIFEHEALANALVLRGIAAEEIDQVRWPGRGADVPLYDCGPGDFEAPEDAGRGRASDGQRPPAASLARLCWPELAAEIRCGRTTAVIPLGATEQHGPHLPCGTDTWIADELARRFCEAVPEALALPALALGCSPEHLGFPGTLDLRPQTLCALLCDVFASLRATGFERAFLFSAHGGNAAVLRDLLPELARAGKPLRVIAHTDLAGLTAALHGVAADCGVAPEAAGHHAGEIETSILAALRPHGVRWSELGPGTLFRGRDAQALFYPRLRANAPNGTVGDPREATAARAARYLETWVELLEDCYRRANHDAWKNGIQNA